MDLATVIGLALAWGALFLSLGLEGGEFKDLVNIPAFVLVVFGTIGATTIGSSMKTLFSLPSILKNAMVSTDLDPKEVIDQMVGFARIARREGVLALDAAAQKVENKFLRKGVELVVDGTPSASAAQTLRAALLGFTASPPAASE